MTTTLQGETRLMAHIAALRRMLLRYRFSRAHRKCGPTEGVVSVDARCDLCRDTDAVLAEPMR